MATKQVKVKIRTASSYDTLYPETTLEAVSGLSAALATINANIAGKQATLVSGTNIKTIEGQSILGSGNVILPKGVYYVEGNTSGTSGVWTGFNSGISQYYDGLTVAYKIGVSGTSTTTLNINGFGAKVCRRNAGNLTTHLPVGTVVIFVYTTISNEGYWVWADYDSNTTYSAMDVSEGITGVATTSRVIRADYLKQIIQALTRPYDWNPLWDDIVNKPSTFLPSVHNHPEYLTSHPAVSGSGNWVYDTPGQVISSMVVDNNGHVTSIGARTLTAANIGLGSVLNYGIATQTIAEAGTSNAYYMTPLRVKQAIDALVTNSGGWDLIWSGLIAISTSGTTLSLIAGKYTTSYSAIVIEWNEGGGGNSTSHTRKLTMCALGTVDNSYSTVGAITYTDSNTIWATSYYLTRISSNQLRLTYPRTAGMPSGTYGTSSNVYIHKVWGVL